ncbi:DUF6531 domain-containing protein [Rothia dentocariosa]|uniref:DUF6531 domain-containing protein n=1 Tax=Rothia dentocariosa TaxID=2047 RepID=UPI002447AC4A|nr:DUF6531 domain-containing protein [Rothia dentocariosa]
MVMDTLDPARKNIKVGGPGVSLTSAIPDNLDVYFNQARALSEDLGKKLESIQKEYQGFMENTSWGQFDIMGLLKATGDWAGKNMEDASFVHVIAEAFRQAGASGNMVATYDSSMVEQLLASAGVKAQERGELDIPAATVAGATLSSGYVNDPVNAATGNFIEEELDLSFPGTGSGTLRLERMYNSLAVTHPDEIPSGVFGPGWASTLDQHMEFTAQEARWHTHDGRILFFAREGEGYARCTHEPWWLEKVTIGADQYERFAQLRDEAYSQAKTGTAGSSAPFYWVVSNAKHHRIFFTPAGDWAGTVEGHTANTVIACRDDQNRIVELVHPVTERGLYVLYGENPSDSTAQRPVAAYTYNTRGDRAGEELAVVEYTYEGEHLVSATTNAGTRAYSHTDEGLIREVTNVNGHVEVTNTYDDSGRVIHQLTEYGREVSYTYAQGLMTIVADAETGENPNIWRSDEKGRLVALSAADGSKQTMRYDSWGNRISVTGRDGSLTTRRFDSRSRITRERTPEGADYTYVWDDYDRLTSISVRDARDRRNLGDPTTITYEYDDTANPNPSAVTDGTGATTRFDWNERGNLIAQIDPSGVRTDFTYDSHGDLVAITNGAGDTTRLVRDEFGRVTTIIDGLGYENTLTYSSSGVVTAIQNPEGARWKFIYPTFAESDTPALVRKAQQRYGAEHTRGFLPSAVIDPEGNTTRFTYNQGGDIVSVTDPLGRVTRADYDTWGNLARYVNASGGTWEYTWDGLSQLSSITDPTGATTRYTYDLAGEISSVTDPTGVKAKRFVQRKGGLERTIAASGSSFKRLDVLGRVTTEGTQTSRGQEHVEDLVTYDAAGRPVEILDASGGLTRIERDKAGRPLRVVSAAGRVETYEYDSAGRTAAHAVGLDTPKRIPDAEGVLREAEPTRWAVTRFEYDAASQLVRRINPDGTEEKTVYDSCGRVIRVVSGARVAAYEYDRCGRITSVQDTTYGRRTFAYDAAGQIVRVTDGLGYRTHFSYTENGQVAQVMDATGQVTAYEYDAMDRVTRVTRGTGTSHEIVEEYAYDAAGRPTRYFNGLQDYAYAYNYKHGGNLKSASCNGVLLAEYGRERGERELWVRDYVTAQELDPQAPEGSYLEHRYVYDARGLLIERSRTGVIGAETTENLHNSADTDAKAQSLSTFVSTGAYTLTFEYDADGYRTMVVTPYGTEQTVYDGAGHAVRREASSSHNDEMTVAEYSYDVMGRLVRAQLGDTLSTWEFDGDSGLVSSYTRTASHHSGKDAEHAPHTERTEIIRDREGRIIGLDTENSLVMYSYDAAGQLTGARQGEREFEWTFDAGLMVRERLYRRPTEPETRGNKQQSSERVLLGERTFRYNELNQLVEIIARESVDTDNPLETVTTYGYDAAGRRSQETVTTSQGARRTREYSWGMWDSLAAVTDNAGTGHSTEAYSRVRLVTDAVGELAQVTGLDGRSVPLLWDPTAPIPQVLGAGSVPAPGHDGGFSQVSVPGGFNPWGVGTPSQQEPWGQAPSVVESLLPQGFAFSGAGSVHVAGLDVMGVRTFDAASKHFLSLDPLESVPGTGWFADSYSFVGNNPVGLMDPWGMRPVSIEEYDKYAEHANERFVGKLFLNAVAVVATVAAVAFTGPVAIIALGAIAGAASAAASAMDKVGPDGGIDWGAVGKDALVGGLVGGATAGATKILTLGRGGILWEKGQVAQGIQKYRFLANKAPGRWADKTVTKIRAKNSDVLKRDFIDNHTTFMGKTGGEVIGNMTSGAIEGAYDYSKNAGDDWSVRGMMLSATTGGMMKGASAGFKMAPNYVTNKVNYTKLPGIRHLPDGGRIQRLAASGVKNTTSQIAEMPINVGMSSVEALAKNRILQMDRNDYMAQHPGDNPEALNRAKVKDKSGADLMWDAAGAEIQKQGDYKNLAKNGAKTWKDRKSFTSSPTEQDTNTPAGAPE